MFIEYMKQNTSNENRPQISVKASDIQSHLEHNELVETESITKNYEKKKLTIMDEPLNNIVDKTLNFTVYSFDDYSEALEQVKSRFPNESFEGFSGNLKLHLYASMIFLQINDNIIYVGILCVVLSIIIYFLNITLLG
uniref:Uncharacterized protein n=1 Tax=viral metagenome TaxID=1070528 RepID=A0A6C0F712_9ZZZZ|tara:strand:- start:5398 stop:5811 length:414 start_codon:yes stop_codon:yes gene_type:complete